MSSERDVILLRVGELFLKGKNRNFFFQRLVKNARGLLADLDGVEVEAMYLRVAVSHPPALRAQVLVRLGRLFGLSSLSPATTVDRDLDAFTATASALAAGFPRGSSFKVETKRRDKSFPMTSQAVSREVGGRIFQAGGLAVDVHEPDHVIHIEIGPERCFVYSDVIPGPGGLPIGTAGNVTLLLSGGIDSPVAGWYAMRRGCRVEAVYFHSFPYTGDKSREKVIDLARKLAAWQGEVVVHVVHFTEVQKALRDHGPADLAVVLYRRMMMRAASRIAARARSEALITGENLGQVASQTLANLAAIEAAAELPVLRPLITFDKQEIIEQAKRIGTFDLSVLPYQDCCSLFVPKHPVTRARLDSVERAEDGLDVAAMADQLADTAEREWVGAREVPAR